VTLLRQQEAATTALALNGPSYEAKRQKHTEVYCPKHVELIL